MKMKLKYTISIIVLFIAVVIMCLVVVSTSPVICVSLISGYVISVILLIIDKKPAKVSGFFRVSNLNNKVLLICDKEEEATELMDNSECETKVVFIAFKAEKKKDYLEFLKNIKRNH